VEKEMHRFVDDYCSLCDSSVTYVTLVEICWLHFIVTHFNVKSPD